MDPRYRDVDHPKSRNTVGAEEAIRDAIGLISFVLGATGHRDLMPADESDLKAKIRSVLDKLKMRSTPLLLVTGLAEGADQSVAEVALETGAGIAAVFPMPIDIYKETMSFEACKDSCPCGRTRPGPFICQQAA